MFIINNNRDNMSNELNIMFVSDKDDQTNTLKSISGIDEKGNLKTAPADEAIDQNQFFKVDKNFKVRDYPRKTKRERFFGINVERIRFK